MPRGLEEVEAETGCYDLVGKSAATFVEWARSLPEEAKPMFINDVLERYSAVAGDDHTFCFYQMDIRLAKS